MAITLQLTPEQEAKLRSVAGQLKVCPLRLLPRPPYETFSPNPISSS